MEKTKSNSNLSLGGDLHRHLHHLHGGGAPEGREGASGLPPYCPCHRPHRQLRRHFLHSRVPGPAFSLPKQEEVNRGH